MIRNTILPYAQHDDDDDDNDQIRENDTLKTYFAAISLFRSRLLSRATIIILYKTLIRPVVSYGAEALTLTKKEEQALLIFERKYLEEYMVLNMKMGNGKVGRIENRRDEQRRKYSKTDKRAKDKLVGSPRENEGG